MNYIDKYSELMDEIQKYIKNEKDINFINDVYNFASEAHKLQLRKSGEPYLIHLLNVTYILATWRTNVEILAVGMLHDVIEDQDISFEEINKRYGLTVATLVGNLTKVDKYIYENQNVIKSINLQKILIAMSKDIQVILVKFADRIHNLNTLNYLSKDKQKAIALETENVYLPVARLFGLQNVVDSMGDRIIQYLHPEIYKKITNSLSLNKENNLLYLETLLNDLKKFLHDKVNNIKIEGRIKNIFSIYSKIEKKNKNIDDIYDVYGIRIITENITDCYTVLGLIQSKYEYIKSRFKDYVVKPKKNFYQSIHLTIIFKKINVEIQIKTIEMLKQSKVGLASHFIYKENTSNKNSVETQFEIDNNRKLISNLNNENHITSANLDMDSYIIERINEVFVQNLYILTPKGDCIIMNKGSNALDFAFKIHTNIGMKANSCYINNILKPLTTILQNGDIVEIIKSKNPKSVKELLSKVNESYSKMAIKKFTKQQLIDEKNNKINLGKKIIDKYISLNEKYKFYYNSKNFLNNIHYRSFEDLYIATSKNPKLLQKIFKNYENNLKISQSDNKDQDKLSKSSKKSVFIISGFTNIAATISQCCLPIPGDKIVGVFSKNKGIKIHHINCKNIENIKDRSILYDAKWNDEAVKSLSFLTKIKIDFYYENISKLNQSKEISEVINKIQKSNIKIKEMYTRNLKNMFTEMNCKLIVKNKNDLDKLILSIFKISNVKNVYRLHKHK